MANNEKRAKEQSGFGRNFDFDQIDKGAGLGDISKESDDKFSKHLNNVLLVFLLAVIGLAVFGISFKIGEKIFFVNKPRLKYLLQENVPNNSKEIPGMAVIPKADEAVEGEVKSGVKEPDPVKIVEPSSRQVEEGSKPAMEKNMVNPAKKVIAPVAKGEKPVAAAKPPATAPAAAKAPETPGEYKVIVGSFSIKANAESLISQLKAKNYESIVVQTKTPKGHLYRVIVGPYSSLGETKTKIGELQKTGFQPFYVVE